MNYSIGLSSDLLSILTDTGKYMDKKHEKLQNIGYGLHTQSDI